MKGRTFVLVLVAALACTGNALNYGLVGPSPSAVAPQAGGAPPAADPAAQAAAAQAAMASLAANPPNPQTEATCGVCKTVINKINDRVHETRTEAVCEQIGLCSAPDRMSQFFNSASQAQAQAQTPSLTPEQQQAAATAAAAAMGMGAAQPGFAGLNPTANIDLGNTVFPAMIQIDAESYADTAHHVQAETYKLMHATLTEVKSLREENAQILKELRELRTENEKLRSP